MKYVRGKDGKIEIMEDRDGISAGAETIFSTEPAVYEGTWDKPADYVGRADVVRKRTGGDDVGTEAAYEVDERIGTQKPHAEKVLKARKKQMGWSEPHKAHPTDKVCLNCGKVMKGVRPNRKFCSDNCRKRYTERIRRADAKQLKTFLPHRGKEGQVYWIMDGQIRFIPAIWCDSLKRAEKYIRENYSVEGQEIAIKQIREVMGK